MIKRLLRNKMVPACLSIIVGLILVIWQGAALATLIRVFGYLLLAGAGIFVLAYCFTPYRDGTQLTTAGIGLLLGIVLISSPDIFIQLFPVLMGIMLILNGLSNLMAFHAFRTEKLSGLFSVLAIILGILVLAHPGRIANILLAFIGASYVVNGCFDLYMLHRLKKFLMIS